MATEKRDAARLVRREKLNLSQKSLTEHKSYYSQGESNVFSGAFHCAFTVQIERTVALTGGIIASMLSAVFLT